MIIETSKSSFGVESTGVHKCQALPVAATLFTPGYQRNPYRSQHRELEAWQVSILVVYGASCNLKTSRDRAGGGAVERLRSLQELSEIYAFKEDGPLAGSKGAVLVLGMLVRAERACFASRQERRPHNRLDRVAAWSGTFLQRMSAIGAQIQESCA